jgi:hypothetical protein
LAALRIVDPLSFPLGTRRKSNLGGGVIAGFRASDELRLEREIRLVLFGIEIPATIAPRQVRDQPMPLEAETLQLTPIEELLALSAIQWADQLSRTQQGRREHQVERRNLAPVLQRIRQSPALHESACRFDCYAHSQSPVIGIGR